MLGLRVVRGVYMNDRQHPRLDWRLRDNILQRAPAKTEECVMPRFTIVPLDKTFRPTDFIAKDAGSALAMIDRYKCGEVDVMRDGLYLFTAELHEGGFWSIIERARTL